MLIDGMPSFCESFYFIVINYSSLCLQLKEECTEALERVFKVSLK